MKLKLFSLFLLAFVTLSCKKDKFTTEPQVKVTSISPDEVFAGNLINLKADYTDNEGDLDSALIVYKFYSANTVTKHDTFPYPFKGLNLPPKTRDATLVVTFEYHSTNTGNVTLPSVSKDTTATLGLILIDKASHRSNYSESDRIRLKKV